jgi:peptidoglycan hydrolase CwlO-like protein
MQPTQTYSQALNDAYSQLLDDLNEAYWAASTMDAKDQIMGAIEVVTDVITALDATDLTTRNAEYTALQAQVKSVNDQLQTLQKQINAIISRINTAASIVSDITKAVSAAASLFK